nr:probable carboxylesterase 2 [Ipomoea batatas]
MAAVNDEIAFQMSPYFTLYKDGRIERLRGPESATNSDDPDAAVWSKDVVVEPETGVSVRLFLPKLTDADKKLPLVIYIHGGAFVIGSARSSVFHSFISSIAEKAKVIAVSVEYRLAPEHALPIAYDDSWLAFQWIMSHSNGLGPEPWLINHADFSNIFLGGESAGANIAHDVAIRAGNSDYFKDDRKMSGLFLVHPFFGGKDEDKLYKFLCPSSSARDDDPRLNPAADPRLAQMPCKKVVFHVAENDFLLARAKAYYEALKSSPWKGEVEILEIEGEGHGFHLINPSHPKAGIVTQDLVTFFTS